MQLVLPFWLTWLVLLVPQAMAQTVARDRPPSTAGTANLSGRVLAVDTGLPLRDLTVTLTGRERSTARRSTTDSQGRYAFDDVSAGRYVLVVTSARSRPAYLGTASREGGAPGRLVDVLDGQGIKDLDIRLERACAVSGRVVDDLGQPLANIRVHALLGGTGGLTRTVGSGIAMSDDRGQFRVFGLEPGDFYLKAIDTSGPAAPAAAAVEDAYVPTYYPGTTNIVEAPLVTLEPGQDLEGLEIRLVRSRTYRLSGLVLGSDGQPAGGAHVFARQVGDAGMQGSGQKTRADGTFEITRLTPGTYVLTALPGNSPALEATEASAPTQVTVSGSDVDHLLLTLTPGVTLEGQIVTEAGAVPAFPPGGLRVTTAESTSFLPSPPSHGTVADDWTFRITGVRAPVVLRTIGKLADGWHLQAVRYHGVDITEAFTEFSEAASARDLQVVITDQGARLTGAVTDADGRPAVNRQVLLLPADPQMRRVHSVRFRAGRTDDSGRFTFDQLPAGDYLVVSTEKTLSLNTARDPRAFDWLVPLSARVTIEAGDDRTLDLRLVDRRRH